jgi:hypothetical protein
MCSTGRHDIQYNSISHYDTQHYNIQYYDTQHNRHNCATQHKRHTAYTLNVVMLSFIMLSVVMLNVIMLSVVAPLHQCLPHQKLFFITTNTLAYYSKIVNCSRKHFVESALAYGKKLTIRPWVIWETPGINSAKLSSNKFIHKLFHNCTAFFMCSKTV